MIKTEFRITLDYGIDCIDPDEGDEWTFVNRGRIAQKGDVLNFFLLYKPGELTPNPEELRRCARLGLRRNSNELAGAMHAQYMLQNQHQIPEELRAYIPVFSDTTRRFKRERHLWMPCTIFSLRENDWWMSNCCLNRDILDQVCVVTVTRP